MPRIPSAADVNSIGASASRLHAVRAEPAIAFDSGSLRTEADRPEKTCRAEDR